MRLRLEGAQSGKKSVQEAKKAAIEGFSPPKGQPGYLDPSLDSSWDTLAKRQNLTTYHKNNLFYFGQKGKPPVIEAIEVGDKFSVGDSWAYPIYTIDARGIQVKTLRYEPKKVDDPTLFKGTGGERNAWKAITDRGLLATHKPEFHAKEDGYRIVTIPDPEVDRYPGTFGDMEAVNKFKQDNPEWADYDVRRDGPTGRILLEKPKMLLLKAMGMLGIGRE